MSQIRELTAQIDKPAESSGGWMVDWEHDGSTNRSIPLSCFECEETVWLFVKNVCRLSEHHRDALTFGCSL